MNCLEARKCIYRYLNKQLEDEELRDFLEHIATCRECMEELKVTHMVYTGVEKLDSDDWEQINLDNSFRTTMDESRLHLLGVAARRVFRMSVDTVVFWSVLITLLLQLRIWFQG